MKNTLTYGGLMKGIEMIKANPIQKPIYLTSDVYDFFVSQGQSMGDIRRIEVPKLDIDNFNDNRDNSKSRR
jgi:hypothetical protein